MEMHRKPLGKLAAGLAVAASCWGLAGCGDDDDPEPATLAMRVTNAVDGVTSLVETNFVSSEELDPVATPDPPAAAALHLLGSWNGVYENQGGRSRLHLDIGTQDGNEVSGQVSTGGMGEGVCGGTLSGNRLVLTIHFFDDNWMRLEGDVNGESTLYRGTWSTRSGNSGSFGVER